ncbi:MAG TPA: hypothetical protein VFX70_20880 [Mycobacteriales bacterium]|nr:hypothetical protein [Mycobacteriales bacterium]
MNVKRLLTWVGIAFVAFYLLSSPQDSADLVKGAVGNLGTAADKMAQFVKSLVG